MRTLALILFLAISACTTVVKAQQPEIIASCDVRNVYVGDTFTYKVEVIDASTTPTIHFPSTRNFSIVNGPMQSSRYSINNGVQSSTRGVSYVVVALEAGKLTIPPAQVIIKNKSYQSNAVSIEVLPQPGSTTGAQSAQSKSPTQKNNRPDQSSRTPQKASPELMVRAEPNVTHVVVGEPVTITYKLFAQVRVYNYGIDKLPDAVGFWAEEIEQKTQPQLKPEIVEGVNYQSAVLKEVVYYPTRSGELTIEPLRINFEVQTRKQRTNNFFNDPFFDDVFARTQKVLFTDAVKLRVDDVPKPTPANYTGAVGQFQLAARLDTNVVSVNDAVGFNLTLQGTGNFKTLNLPELKLPDDIDMFKPEKEEKINLVNAAYRGYKRMTYLLVPRKAGDIIIPPIELVYYDSQQKRYRTTKTVPIQLIIQPVSSDQPLVTSGYTRKEVALMNRDLRFIKLQSDPFVRIGDNILHKSWYWLVFVAGTIFIIGAVFYEQRENKIETNQALSRRLKAFRNAQQLIKLATKAGSDEKQVYFYLSQALVGYIGDSLNLPEKSLVTEALAEAVKMRTNNEKLVNELHALLIRLDRGRFAPGADESSTPDLIRHATHTIQQLSREIK